MQHTIQTQRPVDPQKIHIAQECVYVARHPKLNKHLVRQQQHKIDNNIYLGCVSLGKTIHPQDNFLHNLNCAGLPWKEYHQYNGGDDIPNC